MSAYALRLFDVGFFSGIFGAFYATLVARNVLGIEDSHSSEFAPDPEPTIKTGISTMTLGALELLGRP